MFTTCMASLAFPCIARFLSENYPSSVFTLHREVTFLYLLDFMSAICSLHLISCFLIFNSLSFFHTYFDTLFILFSSSVFLLTLHSIQYNQVNLVIYIWPSTVSLYTLDISVEKTHIVLRLFLFWYNNPSFFYPYVDDFSQAVLRTILICLL